MLWSMQNASASAIGRRSDEAPVAKLSVYDSGTLPDFVASCALDVRESPHRDLRRAATSSEWLRARISICLAVEAYRDAAAAAFPRSMPCPTIFPAVIPARSRFAGTQVRDNRYSLLYVMTSIMARRGAKLAGRRWRVRTMCAFRRADD